MTIEAHIEAIYKEVVGIRRTLHRCPELGFDEIKTSEAIKSYLKSWGIPYETVITTGVVATITGHKPGKTVAIRADIDALPLLEDTNLPFESENKGCMHACGHDAHAAIALGVGKMLMDTRESWTGQVKLLFQPAEETDGGARPMVKAGVMDKPKVDYVIGLHVMPYYDAGVVELKYGQLNASSDLIKIEVDGKASHGAYPHTGIDAIVIAGQVISALQQIVSRSIAPTDGVVVTIGTIHGGAKYNNIAEKVTMEGTLRTLSEASRKLAKERISAIVEGIAMASGGQAKATFEEGYCVLVNDDAVVDVLKSVAIENLGPENVKMKAESSMGVDDMAYFLQAAPGAYFHLGCGNAEEGLTAPLHSRQFTIDESCMKTGMMMEIKTVLALLEGL